MFSSRLNIHPGGSIGHEIEVQINIPTNSRLSFKDYSVKDRAANNKARTL